MDPRLFIFNFVDCLSIVVSIGVAIVAFVKGGRKSMPVMLGLTNFSFAFFQTVYLVGINTSDPSVSRTAFLISIGSVFSVCFNLHWLLARLGFLPEKRRILAFFYSVASVLVLFVATFPVVFLGKSMPLGYFPNYWNPGPFFFLPLGFFAIALCYMYIVLFQSYQRSDFVAKNRLRYFLTFTIGAYAVGGLAVLPAYGISIDPILSILAPFAGIPIAYAALESDILNLKDAVKRFLAYGFFVALLTAIITLIDFINGYIMSGVEGFPRWPLPLIMSAAVIFIGGLIWQRLRDIDILKYEFITVVTHKFRTPLTHIKWSLDMLRRAATPDDRSKFTEQIEKANSRLVDLTDILIGLVKVDSSDYQYHLETIPLEPIIQHAIDGVKNRADEKQIKISFDVESGVPPVTVDVKRLQFVFQIILENAVSYTPVAGSIGITLGWKKGTITIIIHDTGIGISRQELPHVFSKFYRSPRAKAHDTEGMGIGLYMAKSITERLGGKISVESAGEGQGTTFCVKLPPSVA